MIEEAVENVRAKRYRVRTRRSRCASYWTPTTCSRRFYRPRGTPAQTLEVREQNLFMLALCAKLVAELREVTRRTFFPRLGALTFDRTKTARIK